MAHSPKPTIYFGNISDTPIGDIWVACSERGLVAVDWEQSESAFVKNLSRRIKTPLENNPRRLTHTDSQLREYLAGERKRFTVAIDWSMMRSFQREALLATFAIPYGQTSTYGEIAMQIGRPRSARAVGRAEATNPMPLVIPCHRVLGSDGKLRGYGGGLNIKKWLLRLEGAVLA
ncbi:MAG: methylated-DNA--[protein]-cysteine S-methyltransferase [Chloroflexi bacterium]|nr:methylated-DNA--[protein]-cysteine S-methyltransferase [Chloroflexota bacterium]